MFNLIITHEPGLDNYRWARNQIRQLIGEGLRYVSSYQSVILYDTDLDPHDVALKLRTSLKGVGTPIIRVIPIDEVVEPYLDEVIEAVKHLLPRLPTGVSFRITIEGHLFGKGEEGRIKRLHTREAVEEIAKYVDNPVNLDNPGRIIYVKVVRYLRRRRKAGVSILTPEELRRVSLEA